MPDLIINNTQSVWSKGMQSKVVSARNDTDIIGKGASILDNVSIMQQGGIRKRPCARLSTEIGIGAILKGIFRLGSSLWAVYSGGVTQIFLKKIDSVELPTAFDFPQLANYNIAKIRIIQDGNTLLVSGIFVVITYDPDTNTFTNAPFLFNSIPYAPRLPNTSYFTSTPAAQSVTLFYRGTGDATSLAQAQINGFYLSVGQNVVFNITNLAANIPTGTLIIINGLIIKLLTIYSGGTIVGVVMYGSTAAQALIKKDSVTSINNSNQAVTWNNVYCVTSNGEDIIFQANSWGSQIYPTLITNFQNRLIGASALGVSQGNVFQKIPANDTTIWCSAAGNKFSFLQTSVDDASPFNVIISGDIAPKITNIIASDYLYVFTNYGTYAFINETNSQFTTSNINLKKIGNHRCSDAVPVFHDGQIFYINENQNGIFSLSKVADGIIDIDRTILCPTFFKNVSQLAATNGVRSIDNNSDNSPYLFAIGDNINQTTGESEGKCILSYQFVASQGLDGWSRWTFEDSQPVYIYTVEDKIFALFDDGVIYEFVYGLYEDEVNNKAPMITIKTNPFSFRDQVSGDILFRRKKYSKVSVYYLDTSTITVNDVDHAVGSLFNNTPPQPVDGIQTWGQFDNFSASPFTDGGQLKNITITHKNKSNLIILAVEVKLEVSDK